LKQTLSRCPHERRDGEFEEETAMKTEGKAALGRREFLRTIGAGAGVAAASAVPVATAANADSESNADKRKARYRETDHVKTFYRVNSYPTK
jgi:hypothetical protein